MRSSYTFSPINWGGQNPQSPTTGAEQYSAGSGRHTERMQRARAVRSGQMYALPVLPNPLGAAAEFAREIELNEELHRRSVVRDAVVGGVLGAGLMYALRNRGRR